MMSVNEKIRLVNERFKQIHVNVDYEWLTGCVQFFCEERPSATIDQLLEQTDEQWQLSDLSDSGCPCLPDSIFSEKQSHIVSGTYPLQLQYLIDIAESAYDQLQRIHNKQLDEGREQQEFKQTQAPQRNNVVAKAKRVLKLELFDGRRSVTAMEYRPIPCLNTKLSPGCKVLLTGPIRCVNHVLLLEAKNIRLLGGEVETLLIANAFENVLLRKLNRPLNPKPKTNYAEEPTLIDSSVVRRPALPCIPMSQTQSTAPVTLDDDLDDELLLAVDEPPLPPTQPLRRQQEVESHRINHVESDSFGDLDESAFMQIDRLLSGHTATEQPASVMTATMNQLSPNAVETMPRNTSVCDENYSFKIRGINLAFIHQLQASPMADKLRRRHFMVKAKVLDVTENAHVTRGKWSLGVVLTDDVNDGQLRVRFDNDVLEKLSGYTAIEIHRINAARKTRPHVDEDLQKVLTNLTLRLEQIHSFMKIEYSSESEFPMVREIIESAPVLERKLNEKLQTEVIPSAQI